MMSEADSHQKDTGGARGPLHGIVVLDLSRVLAGPYCTLLMADLGARVIKIEMPERGDDARHVGPFLDGKSLYFAAVNRGKESIALDLKDPDDRTTFERLLDHADVLVENFRPGTMEKLGLGWDRLHARYPRLVYAAASGFGHSGPLSTRPAYDMIVQAMGGIMSITGHLDGPPTRVGTSIGDIAAGLFTACATNAALLHRERTGEGTKIDVGMFDCQLAILENAVARYTATGIIPGPTGARHPSIAPFEPFNASDGFIVLAAGNDALFKKLCHVIGREDLIGDERFRSNATRTQNAEDLRTCLNAALSERGVEHWLEAFDAAGVPCGPLNNIAQALDCPQVAARNMLLAVEGEDGASLRLAGNPMKISSFPDPSHCAPVPRLDENRARILDDFGIRQGPADPRRGDEMDR